MKFPMKPEKISFYMRPNFPIRLIYTKEKPQATVKKDKTIQEQLDGKSQIAEVDSGRGGSMEFISQSLNRGLPKSPVLHWKFAQISVQMRQYRVADALRVYINTKYMNKLYEAQDYLPVREEKLGADLAAAYFLLSLGAHIKFVGHDEYVHGKRGKSTLPTTYDSSYKLEAIKLCKVELFDNGYKSLRNLSHVKHFDASKNMYFNDAQLDRVYCQFGPTLESIDVSSCINVTSSGLTNLARFRKLKHAKLEDLKHVSNLEFLCLLLQESNERLKISGVDLDSLEDTMELSDIEADQTLKKDTDEYMGRTKDSSL